MSSYIVISGDEERPTLELLQLRLRRAAMADLWEEVFDFARGIVQLKEDDKDVRAAQDEARAWMAVAERRLSWEHRVARDQQTGKVYVIRHEDRWSTIVAALAMGSLLAILVFLAWGLIDVWTRRYLLLQWIGFSRESLDTELFRLLAYTGIAGAIGGATDSFRSLVAWHCEAHAYGPRFFWKDVGSPLVGGLVGIFVYLILRTGTGAINGELALDRANGIVVLSAFAIAFLAGFSWHQVFKWLDDLVNQRFRTSETSVEVDVPDLVGLAFKDVRPALAERQLNQGAITGMSLVDPALGDSTVVKQSPSAGSRVDRGTRVDFMLVGASERSARN
jgi:PASTA domain